MINNKLFLLVGSILIILVVLYFLRKRILNKIEKFITEVTTEQVLVSKLPQGPLPVQDGGLIPTEATTAATTESTTFAFQAPITETVNEVMYDLERPGKVVMSCNLPTTVGTYKDELELLGDTDKTSKIAIILKNQADNNGGFMGYSLTQEEYDACIEKNNQITYDINNYPDRLWTIYKIKEVITTQATTEATTEATTATLALEDNTDVMGLDETQKETEYINTINMQNIAQNLNNNVNLAPENTINNALNSTTQEVNNNTTQEVNNNTTQEVNNVIQKNSINLKPENTINSALQQNIVKRVEKLENILATAPVAYNSLDKFNDITIDINFV